MSESVVCNYRGMLEMCKGCNHSIPHDKDDYKCDLWGKCGLTNAPMNVRCVNVIVIKGVDNGKTNDG